MNVKDKLEPILLKVQKPARYIGGELHSIIKDKSAVVSDPCVIEALRAVQGEIGKEGRALLRQSGTEPVIRIMVESKDEERCRAYVKRLSQVIIERGHRLD